MSAHDDKHIAACRLVNWCILFWIIHDAVHIYHMFPSIHGYHQFMVTYQKMVFCLPLSKFVHVGNKNINKHLAAYDRFLWYSWSVHMYGCQRTWVSLLLYITDTMVCGYGSQSSSIACSSTTMTIQELRQELISVLVDFVLFSQYCIAFNTFNFCIIIWSLKHSETIK